MAFLCREMSAGMLRVPSCIAETPVGRQSGESKTSPAEGGGLILAAQKQARVYVVESHFCGAWH
jgi:hypothetical protein